MNKRIVFHDDSISRKFQEYFVFLFGVLPTAEAENDFVTKEYDEIGHHDGKIYDRKRPDIIENWILFQEKPPLETSNHDKERRSGLDNLLSKHPLDKRNFIRKSFYKYYFLLTKRAKLIHMDDYKRHKHLHFYCWNASRQSFNTLINSIHDGKTSWDWYLDIGKYFEKGGIFESREKLYRLFCEFMIMNNSDDDLSIALLY
jgi:hypothetical protein